jgi:hypothetical protein
MQYTIIINQYGIAEQGLLNKTDLTDWAIIDHLYKMFFSKTDRRMIVNDKEYVLISYNFIIKNMPLLHIENKMYLIRRFKKLRNLGLVETIRGKDRYQYFRLTSYLQSIYINQIESQKLYAKS